MSEEKYLEAIENGMPIQDVPDFEVTPAIRIAAIKKNPEAIGKILAPAPSLLKAVEEMNIGA